MPMMTGLRRNQYFFRETVRTGADGDGSDLFRPDGGLIECAEPFHGRIGVGERLKIGDISAAGILPVALCLSPVDLRGNRESSTFRVFAAAALAAENAAAL